MKERKGASPVPGPTMMMGVASSAGSLQEGRAGVPLLQGRRARCAAENDGGRAQRSCRLGRLNRQ